MARSKATSEVKDSTAAPAPKQTKATSTATPTKSGADAKPAAKPADKAPAKPAAKPVAQTEKKPAAAAAKGSAKKLPLPEKFTLASMSTYLSDLKGISRKDAREMLDTVFGLVEAGVMQGDRVPVGALGKVHVKIKPATKARQGRNPITGAAIKIAAKKATKVPRFTFSKAFKEAVLKAKVKT
jgi:nucleoid DNA-binding protein